MVGTYEVLCGEKKVGTVQVEREGLYYRFSCRCDVSPQEMKRLWMRLGSKETDLGLCVPVDGRFGTDKRLPIRQCGDGKPQFLLRHRNLKPQFVPLSPEEPFRYLHRLEHAYLEQRGNTLGIVIPDEGSV